MLKAQTTAVAGTSRVAVSLVHRKRLGNDWDLERLLASVLLSSLGDARGLVVVRQHCCGRSRVSSVGGAKKIESGV